MLAWIRKAFASPGPRLTLAEKLAILRRGGFQIAAPFTANDLVDAGEREEFEKPGFDRIVTRLGGAEERPPWRNFCVNLWHFDTECIEDHGDYARIAERLRDMAQGSLPVDHIRDHVDIEAHRASLDFDFRGRAIHLDFAVNDDWVDEKVFAGFGKLLAEADPASLYVVYQLFGQDMVIGCVTHAQLATLQQAGVDFKPFT